MLSHPAFTSDRYRDAVVATRPAAYYRLRGAQVRDEMGGADGTITGTITRLDDGAPPGILDGTAHRLTNGSGGIATAGTAAWPTTAYTIACWAKITAQVAPDTGIWGKHQTGTGALFYKPNNTTVIYFHQGTSLTSGALALGAWRFFAGTWDGSNLRFYIDGALAVGPTASVTAPGDSGSWCIGSYTVAGVNTSRIMTGSIAEPARWSRALTAGEVAHLSALGFGR